MATGTVRLHRILRATPERIYRAFLEAGRSPSPSSPSSSSRRSRTSDGRWAEVDEGMGTPSPGGLPVHVATGAVNGDGRADIVAGDA